MKLYRVRVVVRSDVWAGSEKEAADRVRTWVFQAITGPATLAALMNPQVTTATDDVTVWGEPA